MAFSHLLEAYMGRRLRRLLGPVMQRRHDRTLRLGQPTAAERARARSAWWGGEPRWYPGGTPPTAHNRVTPLVDGAAFFAALHADLLRAEAYVYIAGWCLTPTVPLRRETRTLLAQTQLGRVLADVARRVPVRVLLWGGAAAFFQPTTRMVREARATLLDGGGDLRCALDLRARPTHTHHQKAIVIDGQVAYVGGMDLTTFEGDRWDTPAHPLRVGPTWHDVQLRLEGQAVADVGRNFRQRWQAVTGEAALPHRDPAYDPAWRTPLQIVRTIPARTYPFAPRGEFGIRHAYLEALRGARRLIYLENQYLWSPQIMAILLAALRDPPTPAFRIVLMLPAQAADGKFDNDRHVAQLRAADAGRGLVAAYCPYASGVGPGRRAITYRPTYVHAKVALVDDAWCLVGSANLNDRGLVTDTELDAVVCDAPLARALRMALWAEHLGLSPAAVAASDATTLIDGVWRERAAANAAIMGRGDAPLVGAACRYEPGRMPGSWLLQEAQVLTFEH
jgi:phosphatidylserine/phosphatidylglycerophosphate/cardiolipin synthase-like enzyme